MRNPSYEYKFEKKELSKPPLYKGEGAIRNKQKAYTCNESWIYILNLKLCKSKTKKCKSKTKKVEVHSKGRV